MVRLLITKLRNVYAESVSEKNKIGEYLAKLQARRWLSRAHCAPSQHTAESRRKCTTQFTFSARNYAKNSPILKIFPLTRLINKRLVIWLLTAPPHLEYVTTVLCNLSLITALVCDCHSFSDINVSQGSVATHMKCGGIFNKFIAANILENLTVEICDKPVEN